jgi:hypothetical protein
MALFVGSVNRFLRSTTTMNIEGVMGIQRISMNTLVRIVDRNSAYKEINNER